MRSKKMSREEWEGFVEKFTSPEEVVWWAVSGEFSPPMNYPEVCRAMIDIICGSEGWNDLEHVPRDVTKAIYNRVYDMLTEMGFTISSPKMLKTRGKKEVWGSWSEVKKKKYLFTCPVCGPEYSFVRVLCRIGDHDAYVDVDPAGMILRAKYQADYVGREKEMYIYWIDCVDCYARWSPAATEEEFRAYYRLLGRPWPFGDGA